MKQHYAQAFLEMLQEGMPVEAALTGLRAAMEKKSHTKLFVPVLLEVQRVLEAKKGVREAVVATATTASATALKSQIDITLAELGVSKNIPLKAVVDETLVGGFVATFDYKEHDQSYKKALTNLFESITK